MWPGGLGRRKALCHRLAFTMAYMRLERPPCTFLRAKASRGCTISRSYASTSSARAPADLGSEVLGGGPRPERRGEDSGLDDVSGGLPQRKTVVDCARTVRLVACRVVVLPVTDHADVVAAPLGQSRIPAGQARHLVERTIRMQLGACSPPCTGRRPRVAFRHVPGHRTRAPSATNWRSAPPVDPARPPLPGRRRAHAPLAARPYATCIMIAPPAVASAPVSRPARTTTAVTRACASPPTVEGQQSRAGDGVSWARSRRVNRRRSWRDNAACQRVCLSSCVRWLAHSLI